MFRMNSYLRSQLHVFSSVSPLIGSLIAPLVVLLDIPALTERWYTRDGGPHPNPLASLVLSGFSLGFSLIATILLVVWFSLIGSKGRIATSISVLCWIIKVVTGIVNLAVFGALTQNNQGFAYAEGFWSAIISIIASGIVLFLLLLHWIVEFRNEKPGNTSYTETPENTRLQIRIAGRHFMLQNAMLIALIALAGLMFSKIENWSYVEGIYFTTVTFLTIGFGDIHPRKSSTKVLLFPLALLGITLLAGSISTIVSFYNKHRKQHKNQARAAREMKWKMEQLNVNKPSLGREIEFISKLHEHHGWREQSLDLLRAALGFLTFWFVGAAIFGASESRPYGDALYFCYLFFLSLGYGGFTLVSPASRVILIVYSLMAVPIMVSFAFQAMQNILEHASTKRMDKRRAEAGDSTSPESVEKDGKNSNANGHASNDPEKGYKKPMKEEIDEMHSTLVLNYHTAQKSDAAMHEQDLEELLEHAVALERVARRLLVAHLEEGSRAQVLLRADWNIQARDLRILESEGDKDPRKDGLVAAKEKGTIVTNAGVAEVRGQDREEREEADIANTAVGEMDEEETIASVRAFRRHVAGMLALGSRVRHLEGAEKCVFERCR